MPLSSEHMPELEKQHTDVEVLVHDLDQALNAVVTATRVDANSQVGKFAESLEKGEVPVIEDPESQGVIDAWADMNNQTILSLRQQYRWFFNS